MIRQQTVKNLIKATGVGVHTGKLINMTLRPAAVNTGIVFRRIDLDVPVEIKAEPQYIGETVLSTCLVKDGVRVATVEHLMSALAGLGIDNIYIDLDADEVPIMDGSASPFLFLLKSAGIEAQGAAKKFLKIKDDIEIVTQDKFMRLTPYNGFKINFSIDFKHPCFDQKNQSISLDFANCSYSHEIARARTFGFMADYKRIRENNQAQGSSLENAVVFDDYKVMNEGGLRYSEEPLRHKILDVIGDLYLLGYPIIGELTAHKSGHGLNYQLLKAILQSSAYDIVEISDEDAGGCWQQNGMAGSFAV